MPESIITNSQTAEELKQVKKPSKSKGRKFIYPGGHPEGEKAWDLMSKESKIDYRKELERNLKAERKKARQEKTPKYFSDEFKRILRLDISLSDKKTLAKELLDKIKNALDSKESEQEPLNKTRRKVRDFVLTSFFINDIETHEFNSLCHSYRFKTRGGKIPAVKTSDYYEE
jgi:hypothetical protein